MFLLKLSVLVKAQDCHCAHRLRYSSLSGSFILIVPTEKELTLLSPPRIALSNEGQVGGGMWGNSGLLPLHLKVQRESHVTVITAA